MLLFRCIVCGLDFRDDSIVSAGPGVTVVVRDFGTTCPKCGGLAKSYDGTYQWFETAEAAIKSAGITKSDARRILKKISEARELSTLPISLAAINSTVADAVEDAIEKAPNPDAWTWVVRISALVALVAGVNSFSDDYDIDTAIAWLKSEYAEYLERQANKPTDGVSNDKPLNPRAYRSR